MVRFVTCLVHVNPNQTDAISTRSGDQIADSFTCRVRGFAGAHVYFARDIRRKGDNSGVVAILPSATVPFAEGVPSAVRLGSKGQDRWTYLRLESSTCFERWQRERAVPSKERTPETQPGSVFQWPLNPATSQVFKEN